MATKAPTTIDGHLTTIAVAAKGQLQLLCEGLLRLLDGRRLEVLPPLLTKLTRSIASGCVEALTVLEAELRRVEDTLRHLRALEESPLFCLGEDGTLVVERLETQSQHLRSVIETLRAIHSESSPVFALTGASEPAIVSDPADVSETMAGTATWTLSETETSSAPQESCRDRSSSGGPFPSPAPEPGAISDSPRYLDQQSEELSDFGRTSRKGLTACSASPLGSRPPANNPSPLDSAAATALVQNGRARLLSGDLQRALVDICEAIRLNNRDPAAYCARGDAHSLNNRLDDAIADYSRALELQPEFLLAKYNRAVACRLSGKFDRALTEFNEILLLRADHAPSYLNRGILHGLKGEWDLATRDFRRTLRLQPKSQEALRHLQAVRALMQDKSDRVIEPDVVRTVDTNVGDSSAEVPIPALDLSVSSPAPQSPREVPNGLVVHCPGCKIETSVRYTKLQPGRVLTCPHCHANFTMKSCGDLEEIVKDRAGRWVFRATVDANFRTLRERRLQIVGVASIVMLCFIVWWGPRIGQSSSIPIEAKLPDELEARAEMLARAWLSGDIRTMRRMTDPVQDKRLFLWCRRYPSPHMTQNADELAEQVKVALTRHPGQSQLTWMLARFEGLQGRSSPLEMQFAWEERAGIWYFQPAVN